MDPALLTRRELATAGYSDTEIRTLLRRGTLCRLAAGTYVVSKTYEVLSSDDQYRCRVLALAAGARTVVSHVSAAALHRLPLVGVDLSAVHLTLPGRGGARRSGQRQLHAGDLPERDRTIVDGVPVTTVARTLVDLGRTVPTQPAVVVADAALNRELTTWPAVVDAMQRSRWHPRIGQARRALSRVDSRAESAGESLTRLRLQDQGIGDLELQIVVRDQRGRFVGRADLGCLAAGVLLEFDGKVKYAALLKPGQHITDVILAEKKREQAMTQLGWIVVRIDWDDLSNPSLLARRVRAAFHRRPILGTAEPLENRASGFCC